MSSLLEFQYHIRLQFECPVTGHSFCLRCMPAEFPGQKIRDISFRVQPYGEWSLQKDSFGNRIQAGCIEIPHDYFSYSVLGTAELDGTKHSDEVPLPAYRYPTALTGMSEEMKAAADQAAYPRPAIERAKAVMRVVRDNLTYVPGQTNICTSAAEAFAEHRGVCQDYAHVFLAFARASGLTARYVNGLTVNDTASHAWCEIWADGHWIGIDPTRGKWTDESYLVFNRGRDYNDCPMERGVFKGLTRQIQSVTVEVTQQ